jgi:hypothetical protein
MKFLAAAAALAAFASVAASAADITLESQIGQHLLAHARRLDQNYNAATNSWLTSYSVRFQGCTSIKQWNGRAKDNSDVKVETENLVRFRMCPTSSCSANKAAGCSSGYGDYIIDMDTFIYAYLSGQETQAEYACQYYLYNTCKCDNSDDKAEDFNYDYCKYDCFNNTKMSSCIDYNPYTNTQPTVFKLMDYIECRQIENQNNNNDKGGGTKYYVGPYCASQGGAIKLGLFTDDTCTDAATSTDYFTLTGSKLPYSTETETVIGPNCLDCLEKQDSTQQNENDQVQVDYVNTMCETLYASSGKCEASLPSGTTSSSGNNNAACTYMEGIRIVRKDGIIDTGTSRSSAVATSFIVLFAMGFTAMAFYVWYLRTRLGVKKNTLL